MSVGISVRVIQLATCQVVEGTETAVTSAAEAIFLVDEYRKQFAETEFQVRVYVPGSVADEWECSRQHIHNLVNRGDLPAFRVGSKILIRATDVTEYEIKQTCRAQNPKSQPSPSPSVERPIMSSGGRMAVSDGFLLGQQIRAQRDAQARLKDK